jgi:hypothetical protein
MVGMPKGETESRFSGINRGISDHEFCGGLLI